MVVTERATGRYHEFCRKPRAGAFRHRGAGETLAAWDRAAAAYGYRRVGAELRHRGILVNSKKIRRLMREHDLQPKRRKRFVATTDSDHDGPIFPDLARDRMVDGRTSSGWRTSRISRSPPASSIWPSAREPLRQ